MLVPLTDAVLLEVILIDLDTVREVRPCADGGSVLRCEGRHDELRVWESVREVLWWVGRESSALAEWVVFNSLPDGKLCSMSMQDGHREGFSNA